MALKVEELRINNWIESVHGNEEFQMPASEFQFVIASPENYEPIPLTEEWLVKFGFNKDGRVFTSNSQIKEISHKDVGVTAPSFFFNSRLNRWMDSQTRVCIDYVHQLQNLYFALTGQELTT